MQPGPTFTKLRTVAFSCIFAISFIWIVLLCVELYTRWDISDHAQRSLVLIYVLMNSITAVMLPVLLIIQFRPWLDAARILLLLFGHIGIAGGFSAWDRKFQCPQNTLDAEGVCQLLDMYIVMASWVIPAFLLVYAACLAIMVYRYVPPPASAEFSEKEDKIDEEAVSTRQQSLLPIMPVRPPPTFKEPRVSINTLPSVVDKSARMSRPSSSWPPSPMTFVTPPSRADGADERPRKSSLASSESNSTTRSSARLSRPHPARFY